MRLFTANRHPTTSVVRRPPTDRVRGSETGGRLHVHMLGSGDTAMRLPGPAAAGVGGVSEVMCRPSDARSRENNRVDVCATENRGVPSRLHFFSFRGRGCEASVAFGKIDRVLNVLLRSGEIYGIRAVDVQYSCESPLPISQEPGNLWNWRFAALACPSSVRIVGDLVVSDHVAANVAVKNPSGQRRAPTE